MAAETFVYNFLYEDLASLALEVKPQKQALWLSSKHSAGDLALRLRENPLEYPQLGNGATDIPTNPLELKGKMVVGSIIELNKLLREKPKYRKALQNCFGYGALDLVSGGPPCQSFSMAGLRKRDCDKNVLPWEFAKFVSMVKPRFALLENVTGILRAFTEEGVSFHAWFEVAKAFSKINYIPLCLHINARLAGVPQNRPRFVMIGIRRDIYKCILPKLNTEELKLLTPGFDFQQRVSKDEESVKFGELPYFDVKRSEDFALFENSFLHPLICKKDVTVKDALDDLKFTNPSKKSTFVNQLNKNFARKYLSDKVNNHEPRKNSAQVQRRFRVYQVLQKIDRVAATEVLTILKGEKETLSDQCWKALKSYEFLIDSEKYVKFRNRGELIDFLKSHPTKKRTQKALLEHAPAPAALSIPDDACHYDDRELRTLTVREMARIQSFPDKFAFRSKVTTGGKMRRYEVPQYTQVGNAVPPLLGFALGKVIADLACRIVEKN